MRYYGTCIPKTNTLASFCTRIGSCIGLHNTLDSFILASKSFTLFESPGKLVIYISATRVSLHYTTYKLFMKEANVKISKLKSSENGSRNTFCVNGSDSSHRLVPYW